jgi:hypothetical protein
MREIKKVKEVTEDGIVFRFEGEGIKLETLIENLTSFRAITEEAFEHTTVDKKLEIVVRGIPPRSVVIDSVIRLYENLQQVHIFGDTLVSNATELGAVVVGIYKLVVFLSGRRPNKVTKLNGKRIKIVNHKGEVNVFDLTGATIYLRDNKLRDLLAKLFEKLENDKGVEAFEVQDRKGGNKVRAGRNEFRAISRRDVEEEESDNRVEYVTKEKVKLPVVFFDLEFQKHWGFYFNGRKINAKIKDDVLRELTEEGERFGKGDALIVDLEIKREHDDLLDFYVDKGFTVTKFHEHIERSPAKQARMALDGDRPVAKVKAVIVNKTRKQSPKKKK